jgi:hypothetical protein
MKQRAWVLPSFTGKERRHEVMQDAISFAESGLANEHADDRLGGKVFLQCAEGM